jgi:phage terminase large subunit
VTQAKILLPPKIKPILAPPLGSVQYRGLYGGRGSAKSFSCALVAAVFGYAEPLRILCTREFQASIKESFHAELKAAISKYPFLAHHYDVGVDYLRCSNGTEFIFRGLRHNIGSIKSLAKIDLTIVEEAEDVPESSWLALEATVFRQPKSELWAIWNPRTKGSPVDKRFIENPPPNSLIAKVNWHDNIFFPPGMEALRKREQERLDPSTYAHVWEGEYLTNSNAQVLAGKVSVREFDEAKLGDPLFGLDFGFSQDPTAGVEVYYHDDTLYVRREGGKTGLELDDTADYMRAKMPLMGSHVVRADSARPESISYLQRSGLPKIIGVKKGKGSVEDGIQFMRACKEIVIHPECPQTIQESRLYSYKTHRLTGDVLPEIIDAHNHYIDAIRYAIQPLIKPSGFVFEC